MTKNIALVLSVLMSATLSVSALARPASISGACHGATLEAKAYLTSLYDTLRYSDQEFVSLYDQLNRSWIYSQRTSFAHCPGLGGSSETTRAYNNCSISFAQYQQRYGAMGAAPKSVKALMRNVINNPQSEEAFSDLANQLRCSESAVAASMAPSS